MLVLLATVVTVQAQYQYATSNGSVIVTGYSGTGGVVIIPSAINGLPVSRIANEAFYGCTNLTRVTVPESVTGIGDWAFYDCSSLTSLTICNSVIRVGNWAFHHCSSLASVTIGTNAMSLGAWIGAHDGGTNSTVVQRGTQERRQDRKPGTR